MVEFPNSSALDAVSSVDGPGTFLAEIVTGRPEQIAIHSNGLLAKAVQFTSLLDEFTKAAEQLRTAWPGSAAENAVGNIGDSLSSLGKVIEVVRNRAQLLGVSGTLVKTAQQAYSRVVSETNPAVATLIANRWTRAAGVALATAASASLHTFITTVQESLQGLGADELGQEVMTLAAIVTEIEQLFDAAVSDHGGAAVIEVRT
ncbi:MAG TPA: hypothetical protein VHW44_26855 [Pseudonocardiaceae bacterium]|jgi:hypothetical protein|nr:hypothetical protein [Pseudonocardiaceae bacterium]